MTAEKLNAGAVSNIGRTKTIETHSLKNSASSAAYAWTYFLKDLSCTSE